MPSASGSYGRLAGWLTDKVRTEVEIFKILHGLNYSDFYYVQYQFNVIKLLKMHFSRLFSSTAYFKVCFEMCKIRLPFFSCRSLLLSTSIFNDMEILATVAI